MEINKEEYMKRTHKILLFLGILVLVSAFSSAAGAGDVKRMSIEDLKARLDDPNVTIVDVRLPVPSKTANIKIKGAIRENPTKISQWIDKYPKDKTLVFYCA